MRGRTTPKQASLSPALLVVARCSRDGVPEATQRPSSSLLPAWSARVPVCTREREGRRARTTTDRQTESVAPRLTVSGCAGRRPLRLALSLTPNRASLLAVCNKIKIAASRLAILTLAPTHPPIPTTTSLCPPLAPASSIPCFSSSTYYYSIDPPAFQSPRTSPH